MLCFLATVADTPGILVGDPRASALAVMFAVFALKLNLTIAFALRPACEIDWSAGAGMEHWFFCLLDRLIGLELLFVWHEGVRPTLLSFLIDFLLPLLF